MIYAINYANDKFKPAQKLNSQTAALHGADKVIEYSPEDIEGSFFKENREILMCQRGNGYWLWKPYFIKQTLLEMSDGDYLIYADSGSYYVNDIQLLIKCMEREKADIMVFSLSNSRLERIWSKRDAFIIMECDSEEYADTPQRLATFLAVKKTVLSCRFIDEWLLFAQDIRVITDQQNCMGKENYSDFIENRHDQTVLSLLSKKYGLKSYRDPSLSLAYYQEEVSERSDYPQIFESHRMGNVGKIKDLEDKYNESLKELLELWKSSKTVLLYGAGKRAKRILNFARRRSLNVDAYIISDDQTYNETVESGIPIYQFSECPYLFCESIIIVTIDAEEVIRRLKTLNCLYICIDKEMWNSVGFFEREETYLTS